MTKNRRLPQSVAKYFWGDDHQDLSWDRHRDYIAETILERGDRAAASWLLSQTGKGWLKTRLPKFRLSPKSKNFWSIYLT